MQKVYEWILFDADETLFEFDSYRGLQLMFSKYGVTFELHHYHEYQLVNKALWVDYQNGSISAKELQHRRFENWAAHLSLETQELNSAFLNAMLEICAPLDGVVELLNFLKGKVKLGIVTNGFVGLQELRLKRTNLDSFFEVIVISEEVGFAKPHPNIFDYALKEMENPDRSKVLMVGDTPESDLLGGIQSGLDTCWLDQKNRTLPEGIRPTYHVRSLWELKDLLTERLSGA